LKKINSLSLTAFAAVLVAPLIASAQTWRVEQQLKKDFPNQQREVVRSEEINGVRVFHLRINGDRGQSEVQITETGDYVSKAVPTRLGGMPDLVMGVMKSLFHEAPESAKYFERTTYTIDIGGARPVQIEIDAAGRLRDIISGPQLRAQQFTSYSPVDRREAHAVADKIETYFDNARIKQIYQYPEAPGFYIAELTADHGTRRAEVVMDTRKDVPFWRFEIRPHELPQCVRKVLNDLVPGARIERIMRVKQTWYRIDQPAGDDTLTVDIRPTGDVIGVRGEVLDDRDNRFVRRGWDRDGDGVRDRPPVRGRNDRDRY
jgi:hypothetical protein